VSQTRVWLAHQRKETAGIVHQVSANLGFPVEKTIDLSSSRLLADLGDCQMLLLEQREPIDVVEPRLYSLIGANPDLLLVVIVPHPRERSTDGVLLRAGAFDVIDDGPDLAVALAHTHVAAQRVVALQEERGRLTSELAHQDKLSALGVLAAGVSHEINNPCSAILSNMMVLRDQLEAVLDRPRFHRLDALEEWASDWIDSIGDCISAANRIHAIVKTLNVFSRRSDTTAPMAVDVNDEIRTVLRLIGKEIKFQGAIFEHQLDPRLPRVMAPPNSITQVVTNLVVNALQALEASPQPSPRIWIRTSFDDDHVLLEIGDNGPGMNPDVMARIFDPFFTTKPIGKGTGLGLAITKQLVHKMEGEIFVESEPGEGTRFNVIVPRSPQLDEPLRRDQQTPPQSDRLRVLLVDDDELILRSMQRALSSQFECLGMARAQQALEALRRDQEFDVIISDVVMPEMNGLEFFSRLTQQFPELALRTVFISGGITSDNLRASVTDTGRPCLAKPVDAQELIRTIRRMGKPFDDLT
jgi:signal transduction histidine kinase/ActR/RegA family two-component response regulator